MSFGLDFTILTASKPFHDKGLKTTVKICRNKCIFTSNFPIHTKKSPGLILLRTSRAHWTLIWSLLIFWLLLFLMENTDTLWVINIAEALITPMSHIDILYMLLPSLTLCGREFNLLFPKKSLNQIKLFKTFTMTKSEYELFDFDTKKYQIHLPPFLIVPSCCCNGHY